LIFLPSPNRRWYVFSLPEPERYMHRLHIYDAEEKQTRTLTERLVSPSFGLNWDETGDVLYYLNADRTEFYRLDPITMISTPTSFEEVNLTAPDGRTRLKYIYSDNPHNSQEASYWAVHDLVNDVERSLNLPDGFIPLGWLSPQWIILAKHEASNGAEYSLQNYYRVRSDGTELAALLPADGLLTGFFNFWSPDARHLYFEVKHPLENGAIKDVNVGVGFRQTVLVRVDVETLKTEHIISDYELSPQLGTVGTAITDSPVGMLWSPATHGLIWQRRLTDNTTRIYETQSDGSHTRLLYETSRPQAVNTSISPDNRWLYIAYFDSASFSPSSLHIERVNLRTGKWEAISQGYHRFMGFSPIIDHAYHGWLGIGGLLLLAGTGGFLLPRILRHHANFTG
jgi:hypothetical protein